MSTSDLITIIVFVTGGLIGTVWAISSKLATTIINQFKVDMTEMKGDIKSILKTLEENGKVNVKHELKLEEHEKQLQFLFKEVEGLKHSLSLIEKSHYKNHGDEKQ